MDHHAVERAASLIRAARVGRTPIEDLPDDCRPPDEAAAYRIQDELNRQLMAAGAGPLAGHKIGCTTPVMQAYMQILNPCAGAVFARTVHRGMGIFKRWDYVRVGVECEIGVELASDIDPSRGFGRDAVADAVGAVVASIEVVDDRYRDYHTIGTPTLIADDFFNAAEVLGDPVRDWRRLDLAAIHGQMWVNGVDVGTGRGGDILGHPFEALAWLAGSMATRGLTLKAGEFVTLGSIVTTQWVNAGDVIRIAIEGLGEAGATFA